jgi:hypothetical protein
MRSSSQSGSAEKRDPAELCAEELENQGAGLLLEAPALHDVTRRGSPLL